MNVLTQRFPTAVSVDGTIYQINADFRNCLNIILAFEDEDLAMFEKQGIMLKRLYKVVPENIQAAAESANKFLAGGSDGVSKYSEDARRLYSFTKDAKYIYSAIKQTYGIDLETVDCLHWWKFIYMFMDLREDCSFQRIIYYRQKMATGKLTKEEREACAKMSDVLALPGNGENYDSSIADDFFAQLKS